VIIFLLLRFGGLFSCRRFGTYLSNVRDLVVPGIADNDFFFSPARSRFRVAHKTRVKIAKYSARQWTFRRAPFLIDCIFLPARVEDTISLFLLLRFGVFR